MDNGPFGHTQLVELLQRSLHVFHVQRAVLSAQQDPRGLLRLKFVDDAVVRVFERRGHEPLEALARLGNNVDGRLHARLLRPVQKPRHLCAVFRVRLIQMRQQQNVADVEDIDVQPVPVDVVLTVIGVAARVLEKCALFCLVVRHDGGKRGVAAALDHGQVDIFVFPHLLQDKITLRVVPGEAGSDERQRGIEPREIGNGVADRAAGGARDALGDVRQLVLLRPCFDGIGDIYDHIACAANAFFHTSSLFSGRAARIPLFFVPVTVIMKERGRLITDEDAPDARQRCVFGETNGTLQ